MFPWGNRIGLVIPKLPENFELTLIDAVEFIIGSATRSSQYHRTRIDLYRIIYWSSNYLRCPSDWRNKRSAPIFIMCTTASFSPSTRLSACADFIVRLLRIDERRKRCFYVNNVVLIQQQYNSCYYIFIITDRGGSHRA